MKPTFSALFSSLVCTAVFTLTSGAGSPAIAQPAMGSSLPSFPGLPYGAEDILKLCRAGLSEDLIVTYIENSGTTFELRANELIYLRDQGVSDRVLNTMIQQRKALQSTNAAPAVETTPGPSTTVTINTGCPTRCDWCGGPLVSYCPEFVPAAPEPVSTVYVIPYPAARRAYSSTASYTRYPYSRYPYNSYYPFRGPYRYYSSFNRFGCGWHQAPCGHWHGCAHRYR